MTDEQQRDLKKEAIYELYKANKNLKACIVKAINFAEKFERVAEGLRNNPEFVHGLPSPGHMGGPLDYREALLNFPPRQDVIDLTAEIQDWKNKVKAAEDKVKMLGD